MIWVVIRFCDFNGDGLERSGRWQGSENAEVHYNATMGMGRPVSVRSVYTPHGRSLAWRIGQPSLAAIPVNTDGTKYICVPSRSFGGRIRFSVSLARLPRLVREAD